jgi:3-phosphoshikimate 1-carboxyvinyltransferase
MTIAIMQQFGIQVEQQGMHHFRVPQGRYQPKDSYHIEPDASGASYFFAAPLICNGSLTVQNISNPSMQGDIAFLDVLAEMGASIQRDPDQITVSNSSQPRGVEVDMRDIPDTAQTLAAIAPFCSSPTRIRGIASARLKETDRIAATCAELRKLGVNVEEFPDGMLIHPCTHIQPASIATYNDHRMAMAFSLVGLRIAGVSIQNPGCVAKTFPNFFEVLEQLQ